MGNEEKMKQEVALAFDVCGKPYHWPTNDAPLTLPVHVDGDGDNEDLLQYDAKTGAFQMSYMDKHGLGFRPVPTGSMVNFPDGAVVAVLADKALQKAITSPIIEQEQQKEQAAWPKELSARIWAILLVADGDQ